VAFPGFLREIGIRLLQVILVILFYFKILTFHQFIVGSVLIYAITLSALAIFLNKKNIGVNFARLNRFSPGRVKEILTFSSLSFISISAMILIGKTDSLMVTGFLGLAEMAVYTTAYYMATVIEIPKRAITQTATALLAHAFEKANMHEVLIIYRKTALNQFIIGALLMIGVWANLDHIFDLMPKGDTYRAGASVVILIGLAKLIDMAFGPSSEIIGLSRHYRFNLLCVSVLAIIVVVCNYFFIPRFGLVGAAYGSVAALIVFNFVKYFFIYFTFRFQPFNRGTLKVVIISAAVIALNLLLPQANNLFVDLIYRSALITISYSTMILASNTSEEVNRLFGILLERVKINRDGKK
jgi:O-antigen/teichoic acid export membrane protein